LTMDATTTTVPIEFDGSFFLSKDGLLRYLKHEYRALKHSYCLLSDAHEAACKDRALLLHQRLTENFCTCDKCLGVGECATKDESADPLPNCCAYCKSSPCRCVKPTVLRPCPFCGKDNIVCYSRTLVNDYTFFGCDDCGARGPVFPVQVKNQREYAVKSWNRRV
jgi:Lar family restriction alleviation protein